MLINNHLKYHIKLIYVFSKKTTFQIKDLYFRIFKSNQRWVNFQLVNFPSWEKRVWGVHIHTGRGSYNPNLVASIQRHWDGSAALLESTPAVHLMVGHAIFDQSGLPVIATVYSKAPREEIQARCRGRESAITNVKTIAIIGFYGVECYCGTRRTLGCWPWCYNSKSHVKSLRT